MAQTLSPNEIRDRALKFAHDWAGIASEKAEARTFWNEFFNVFGINRRRVASFEEFVKPVRQRLEEGDLFHKGGRPAGTGFIDLLWKGVLIAEHKSLGKDLDSAYKQAAPHQNNPASMLITVFEDDTAYEFYTSEGWLRPHQLWLMNDLQQLRE